MSKFENMKKLRGLAENPPAATLALTDERMRDEIASIQALQNVKLNFTIDDDEAEEESGNG